MISAVAISILSSGIDLSKGNGGGAGDADIDYDCGGSCHSSQGSGTVDMEASDSGPSTGETITVMVTVTEPSLGGSHLVGAFLLSNLGDSGSQPSSAGWTILGDPNGGSNNYVEKQATNGVAAEFTWTLKAPSTPGTYHLYARIHHGPGTLYEENSAGLEFQVAESVSGTPSIDHAPVTKAYIGKPITIEALVSNASEAYIYWKTGTESEYNKVVKMTNSTEALSNQWKFIGILPALNESGTIDYFINATSGGLYSLTPVMKMTVTGKPATPSLTAWSMQNVVLVELVGIMSFTVVMLSVRNGSPRKGKRRNGNG